MASPSPLLATGLVAIGGGIGAALRFHLGRAIGPLAGGFPAATLTANVGGSLAMGLLAGWLARHGTGGESLRLLLGVGLLGGFTTFSAFSLEMMLLIERGQAGMAIGYAAASVAAGLLGLYLGLLVMRATA
ncbi:fluoride efflux transporter CrcB [Qipengyuania sp. JC766]|uniref:fluoride efflux transporter CrcB n=1 Tax=Qipengyuania sp. JC766 TaxID=3232139 RepID=UPI00345ABCD9